MLLSRRALLKGGLATGALLWALPSQACTPAPPTRDDRVRLEFWAFSETRIWWQKRAHELYKQRVNPKLEIDWIVLPYGQMHDKLLIAAEAGAGGPDIADVEISQFSKFLKGRTNFVPLNEAIQAMGGTDKLYTASATDPWSWKGVIYGLGNELNTCLLAYRWDIFDQYGLKTPIQTWQEFAEVGKRLKEASRGEVALTDFPDQSWGIWWMMTLQQGGGFFDSEGWPIINNEKGVRTLDYHQRAVYEDKWAIITPIGPAYNTALAAGKIATQLGPSWRFSGFMRQAVAQTKGKWMLQPFPRWEPGGSRTATWGGTGVCVVRDSFYRDAAVAFVVWEHMTPEAVLFDFEKRNVWPTLKPAWSDPRLTEPIDFFNNQRVGEVIREVSPEIPKWYNSPFWAEVTDATVRVGITPAMQGRVPAKQALDAAYEEAMRVIRAQIA